MPSKAIQTNYAGCRFRSRLEARWAVFFDSLKVPWSYEHEGFDLGGGEWYLPDFWLPEQRLWLEIKPGSTGDDRWMHFGLAAEPWAVVNADGNEIPPSEWMTCELPDEHGAQLDRIEPLDSDWLGRCLLAWGDIPNPREMKSDGGGALGGSMQTWFGDFDWQWTECPECHWIDAQWCGLADRVRCQCSMEEGSRANAPRLLKAYAAARSARFEHEDRELFRNRVNDGR